MGDLEKKSISEEQYKLLFEQNPQPMWIYEVDSLKILEVNDAAVKIYGCGRIGQLVADLMEESVRLTSDTRERVHAEGRHWGLTEEQVDAAIQERSLANLRRLRSERNFTTIRGTYERLAAQDIDVKAL